MPSDKQSFLDHFSGFSAKKGNVSTPLTSFVLGFFSTSCSVRESQVIGAEPEGSSPSLGQWSALMDPISELANGLLPCYSPHETNRHERVMAGVQMEPAGGA